MKLSDREDGRDIEGIVLGLYRLSVSLGSHRGYFVSPLSGLDKGLNDKTSAMTRFRIRCVRVQCSHLEQTLSSLELNWWLADGCD